MAIENIEIVRSNWYFNGIN